MPHPCPARNLLIPSATRQRGAVFIVMLVILIMGVTTALVATLNKATLQTARNNKSAELLVKAKEVVMGYALNGTGSSQRPGDMMRPDVLGESTPNYDGSSDGCLNIDNFPSGLPTAPIPAATKLRCLGRLPWKDYGMSIESPSQSDPLGLMPWYAVSSNLFDLATPINSELLNKADGWITVRDMNGNVISDRVVFVLIIPSTPLATQSRTTSPLAAANQYLDSITVPVGCAAPCVPGTYSNADMRDEANTGNNKFGFIVGDEHRWIDDPAATGKKIEDTTYQFNDKLLYVTIDEMMPPIEKRLLREVKSCIDNYAASSANKYPWAAPISDTTNYIGRKDRRFGRVPNTPSNALTTDSDILSFLDKVNQLQTSLNIYNASKTSTNLSNLKDDGETLKDAANPAPSGISGDAESAAYSAGNKADNLSSSPSNSDLTTLQNYLNTTYNELGNDGLIDTAMKSVWSCSLLTTSTYWDDWKNLVFYQLASGYKPGTSSPSCGTTCLSVAGSGNSNAGSGSYRAAIALAGKMQPSQTSRNANTLSDYLEASNVTSKTRSSTPLVFETYLPTDTGNFATVNDLVMCLDKKNYCK